MKVTDVLEVDEPSSHVVLTSVCITAVLFLIRSLRKPPLMSLVIETTRLVEAQIPVILVTVYLEIG